MKRTVCAGILCAAAGLATATLPPPDAVAKAQAAETSARNAWQGKVNAYLLCKAQDKVAARYLKSSGGQKSTRAATTTATLPLAPCADPGPFAPNRPEQKPLKTSGAHPPTGSATGPPSVNQPSAELAPFKKS